MLPVWSWRDFFFCVFHSAGTVCCHVSLNFDDIDPIGSNSTQHLVFLWSMPWPGYSWIRKLTKTWKKHGKNHQETLEYTVYNPDTKTPNQFSKKTQWFQMVPLLFLFKWWGFFLMGRCTSKSKTLHHLCGEKIVVYGVVQERVLCWGISWFHDSIMTECIPSYSPQKPNGGTWKINNPFEETSRLGKSSFLGSMLVLLGCIKYQRATILNTDVHSLLCCPCSRLDVWSQCSPVKLASHLLKQGPFLTGNIPSLKLTNRAWKWMVGILVSFWEGLFSGANC